jgi:hypothetical protein
LRHQPLVLAGLGSGQTEAVKPGPLAIEHDVLGDLEPSVAFDVRPETLASLPSMTLSTTSRPLPSALTTHLVRSWGPVSSTASTSGTNTGSPGQYTLISELR